MDGEENEQVNFPEWTEYRSKNGLDPLGMQNSSINLYQTFLPGISNVTLRMRYYGLYAWLNRAYGQKTGDTNPETWKRYIRRTEALYALIAYRHGGETGVAGIDWATKKLNNATGDTIEFAQDAEPGSETHYLQQAWGAYGAAYGSQVSEIGILTTVGHPIPVLTEEIGEPLAAVFDDAMGPLASRFFEVIQRGSVSISELDEFSALAPSEIDPSSKERACYQDILLKEPEREDASALSRRLSVLLILKVAGLLGREPKPDEIRWILYAGYESEGRPLDLASPSLEAQRQRWWVYHANDLSHIVMETLLKFALDQLGNFPAGITLERLIGLCVDQIRDAADTWPEDWESFFEELNPAANAYAANDPHSEWSLSRDIVRGAGRNDEKFCSPELAWKAVKLLAIIHKRSQVGERDIAAELGHFNPDAFRSLLSETRFLDRNLKEPFADIIAHIVEERVIRRHMWVALRKFRYQRDYTFLIEMDEGRIRLREKDGPVFTNPRLGPAITFLKDIHLVGGQGLTDLGAEAAGVA
ncbi:hypothetical protein [Pacificoceanicola onchidii]|uniref:hypothetical protein n=1 Tax=Pacificoceanicola onchidii TaxID=2562685 RepID=UPI0010A373C2|nr:hypothetical protein [Pacificoceanicola onchidii]